MARNHTNVFGYRGTQVYTEYQRYDYNSGQSNESLPVENRLEVFTVLFLWAKRSLRYLTEL